MRTCLMVLTLALAGCGGGGAAATGADVPLTVADWKALPVESKYSAETLERLKKGDPNLATADGWETFQKTVIAPSRKKDFPGKR
jgi:hypothetical protein